MENDTLISVKDTLRSVVEQQLPRMLTQVSRDADSPSYGCFDRNFWHYKIRDFSSIILQQGGYALHCAVQHFFPNETQKKNIQKLAAGAASFWNQRAEKHGAFEEYYPFEQGYPPVAFSSLAVAKLVHENVVSLSEVKNGLAIAAKQLLTRFESQAANQQVAGTAALCVIRKIAPELVPQSELDEILHRTFAMQNDEGWFPEYDGPDIGYLSVTMDCLCDMYDFTGDERCITALEKACNFTAWFVLSSFAGAGMHNSRNTDYIVPYSFAKMLSMKVSCRTQAAAILIKLYAKYDQKNHFFSAVDDRYWCHYIGHSVIRAYNELVASDVEFSSYTDSTPSSMPLSGHENISDEKCAALVSCRKGGIITAIWNDGKNHCSDYGWIVKTRTLTFVSHWWSKETSYKRSGENLQIDCIFFPHKEHESTPWKHMALRLMSFVFGNRLIKVLKKIMIFKNAKAIITLTREISIAQGNLIVKDKITGIQENDEIIRAPRFSKRHVASADSYHFEDLALLYGVEVQEKMTRNNGSIEITSIYQAV